MNFYIFPFLMISIVCVFVIRVFMKNSTNGFYESIKEFEEKEKNANYVTKNIDKLELKYIYPNKNILPFKEYDENNKNLRNLIKKQSLVLRKANFDMIRLPLGLTNTDLKEKYGINNFEKISILEDNYNGFIRALFEWANALYDIDEKEDCKIVLKEAIRLEGDISQIYMLITEIYFQEKDKQKLLELRNTVEKYELSFKEKIIKFIDEKINLI